MLNEENKGSSFSGLCFRGSSFSLQPYFIIIEVAYKCKKIASIKISFIDISSYNLSSLRLNSNDVYHRKKKEKDSSSITGTQNRSTRSNCANHERERSFLSEKA